MIALQRTARMAEIVHVCLISLLGSKPSHKMDAGRERQFDIAAQNGFIGMMADAARTAEEQHHRWDFSRQNHGVMSSATRH